MAAFYELRYWKNITQPDGSIIRLEIHGKGIEGVSMTAYEIGPVVQALALNIQGQTDDVDAPIVKTSLSMTFVDAPDHADAWLKKCGDWEEFYTNDATMWKVILKGKKNASSSSYAQLWGGYITPDSFSEELRYRGSVTIVARDNIGHMQDFPFDAEGDENGMISLKSLVETAWAKIESPMQLYWPSARWLECEGVYAFDTLMNVSAFKGKNWYEAVESALYAYGAVMRYNGENQVLLCSLRYMPQQARPSMDQVTHIEPVFIASAHRELTPAARRIEESVSFETGDGWQFPLAKGITFTGSEDDVTFLSKNVFGETTRTSIPVNPIDRIGGEGWQNDTSASLFFNPKMYTMRDAALKEDAERMIFLACNTDGSHRATFRKTVYCKDMEIRFRFGRVVQRDDLGGVQYSFGFASGTEDNGIGSIRIKKVQCYVTAEQNGITQYWTGSEWQTAAYRLELAPNEGEFGIGISFMDITGQAALSFIFENIIVDAMYDYSKGYGLYVPISTMSFGILQGLSLCAKNNVNTNYNEKNNVIISRTPVIAPAMDEVPFPAAIKNGIFYKADGVYLPAKAWNWDGGTPQQMAVYNHLQLLCYHSKPNNLITGDIVNADVIKTAAIYVWGGAEHLLISGTYNYLNGRIEGAVLREFVRYDDMWGDVTGSSLPDVQTDSTTNAEEGGSSSSGVTNENTTNVVIGGEGGGSVTIDPFLSDVSSNPVESKAIKAYVDAADKALSDRITNIEENGAGGGCATPRVEMTAASAAIEPNKFYVWGDAESLNLTLAEGKADELNRYLFQFKTSKTAYTILQLPEDIMWSTDTELDDNDMPVIELSAYHRVEIVDGLATLKRWRIVSKFIEFEDKEFEKVLILNGIGTSEGITKKQASALTSIPEGWFANDGALTSLNDLSKFPNLTDLAARAFMGCSNLKTADLSLIETTDGSIFAGCPLEFASLRTPSLKRLAQNVFPDAYIEEWADMGQITELPDENYGHYGRKDYTKTIVLPSAVKKLPLRTMINYTALENLNTENIEEFADACLAYTSNLKAISFASAKVMRPECLRGSGMVVESFDAPNLENLQENALLEAKIVRIANLGQITTAPRGGTFYESYGSRAVLVGIIFPASVTTIDVYTLYEYTKLQYIVFLSDVPPTAGNDEPFHNTNNCPIYVPDASVEAYKNAANWQRYVGRIRGLSEYTGTI